MDKSNSAGENDTNKSHKANDSLRREKKKLRKQIDELKSIISLAKWNLNISKYKDVENVTSSETIDSSTTNIVPDINTQLQSDLYRFAGFHCVKFLNGSCIFHFVPSNKYEKENLFAVQILNKDGKGALGKWVMPMSVDMDDLISKIPIDNLKNAPAFLKKCKHYIDCYYARLEQFKALMNIISENKNCSLQSNLGYTHISLELLGVYYPEDDIYLDLIIYMMYNVGECWPFKVDVDLKTNEKLDARVKKLLNTFFKCFKSHDLCTAFDQISTGNNDTFVWTKENNDDSPLDIGSLSSSGEESFLGDFTQPLSMSRSIATRKRKLHRKRKKTGQKRVSKRLSISSDIRESQHREKKKHVENQSHNSLSKTETDTMALSHREKDITPTTNAEEMPLNKLKHKLKQTKLKFQIGKNDSNKNDSPLPKAKLNTRDLRNREVILPMTSTPLRKNVQSLKHIALQNFDISDITNSNDIPKKPNKRRSKKKK